MSRSSQRTMAHRLLSDHGRFAIPVKAGPDAQKEASKEIRLARSKIEKAPKVDARQVFQGYRAGDFSSLVENLEEGRVRCRPVHKEFWVEVSHDHSLSLGAFVSELSHDCYELFSFHADNENPGVVVIGPSVVYLTDEGFFDRAELQPNNPSLSRPAATEIDEIEMFSVVTTLAASAFMHAKGVRVKEVTLGSRGAVTPKRRIKGKVPLKFSLIDIGLPASSSQGTPGGTSRHTLSPHHRRGNFATYTPDSPHVSGFVGSMWRSPTLVNLEKGGPSVPTYKIKKPS